MIAIAKKELRAYFTQITGYIFMALMVFLTALFFILGNVRVLSPNYHIVLSGATILFLLMVPILTMRLFAEEIRHKTDQLLYTCPLTVPQIVLGKYLAAAGLFVAAMAVTGLFPLILSRFGPLPTSMIIGAFVGYILVGLAFIALGLFISVLTDNQIISAGATFGVLFLFFIMDGIALSLPVDTFSSLIFVLVCVAVAAFIFYHSTRKPLIGLGVGVVGVAVTFGLYLQNALRFEGLTRGVLDLADIVYFVTFAALFIYFTVNVIEKRRWR